MAQPGSAQEASLSGLRIVRIVLIGGVVIFGAAVWYLVQQAGTPELDTDVLSVVRWGTLALFAVAAVAIFVVKQMWRSAETLKSKQSLNIVGWTVAEGMVLIGATYYFLAADPAFFVVGFLAQLLVAFVYLPVPKREENGRGGAGARRRKSG